MATIDEEHNTAWRLWLLLSQLGELLWQRYEQEFLTRKIEEQQRETLRSESHDNEYPF